MVLAMNNHLAGQPNQYPIKALVLTKDHKPEDPEETNNIESLGEENTYIAIRKYYVIFV